MKRALSRTALAAALVAPALHAGSAAAASPVVVVRPMHSQGAMVRYPRLIAFPNPDIQKRVNALLADREAARRAARMECLNTFRDTHVKHGKASFNVVVVASYISPRYLSLDIRQSEYCGGVDREQDVPDPLTIDLAKGAVLDWRTVFMPGVLPDAQANASVEPQFLAMYRAHYGTAKKPPACQSYVKGGIQLKLWLDAKQGVVISPNLPPAAQMCVADIALTPNEIAPVIADRSFLADLKAIVAPATPPKEGAR
jgi:hypothetical protein